MIGTVLRSSLFRSAGYYMLANAINGAVPFLLLPILTRFLSPAEYGLVAMYTVVTALTGAFVAFGVHGAVSRLYFEHGDKEFPAFVGNCLLILMMGSALAGAVLYFAGGIVERYSAFPEEWLWAVLVTAVGQSVGNIALAIWQVRSMPRSYGVFQVSQSLLSAVISIVLVVMLHMGWQGRVLGQTIATAGAAIVAVYYLFSQGWAKLRPNVGHIVEALRYGSPLVLHVVGGIAISMSDRVIITNQLTLADTGLYVVAGQVVMVFGFLVDAFNRAYAPWLFEKLKTGDEAIRRRIVKGTYLYFVVILVLALMFSAVAYQLLEIFVGERFAGGAPYIFWLALSVAFMGMYYMVTLYIQYQKRTELLALITTVVGCLNVVICYVFVSRWGGIGAAQTAVLTQLMMFLATWTVAARVIDMNWFLHSPKVAPGPDDVPSSHVASDAPRPMGTSIFQAYYAPEAFEDRFERNPNDAIDIIIPVIHTNELWEKNLISIYREIPVRRLLISDGGCTDNSIEIVRRFPRVEVLDHRQYVSLGYCLRKLIEAVESEWFVYLHSDVYLPHGWFEAMKEHRREYDWFGCPQRITAMVEYPNVDMLSGERRPYAGSQMGRKAAFVDGLARIDDDYVYRQEDLVLLDVIERQGFRHGFVEDIFHYHQVMHKESPWARKLKSVAVKVEWSRNEEIRASMMQIKGIVKYLEPSPVLALEVETHLRGLIELGAINQDEFKQWVLATNPVWSASIKPWRVRMFLALERIRVGMRKLLNYLRTY